MPEYVVNDQSIKQFLITYLDGHPFQHDPDFTSEINTFLSNFEDVGKLSDAEYQLKDKDRTNLLEIINSRFGKSDGKVIPISEMVKAVKNYDDRPDLIDINDLSVGSFISNVGKIDVTHIPGHANFDLALRVYFGHEITTVKGNNYGVLIVPILSPKDRDHKNDLEKVLFPAGTVPFALAVSDSAKGETGVKDLWREITANADNPFSDTELEFFSVQEFNKFRDGIDSATRKNMRIRFGRIDKEVAGIIVKSICGIFAFVDENGNELPSKALMSGMLPIGLMFNQGDLIPPPPVSDKSF